MMTRRRVVLWALAVFPRKKLFLFVAQCNDPLITQKITDPRPSPPRKIVFFLEIETYEHISF